MRKRLLAKQSATNRKRLEMANEETSMESYIEDFLRRRNLRRTNSVETEWKGIHWTSEGNVLVNRGYGKLSDDDFLREPAVGFLLNLLHRAVEHLDAGLVAFVTGSTASSEGLSRLVVELSMTIQYILAGQRESRLLAFLDDYLKLEVKRLKTWEESIHTLQGAEKAEQVAAIAYRRSGVKAMKDVWVRLQHDISMAGIPLTTENWPNVLAMFSALGKATAYRTIYMRMSSQIHSDAEETIRYFMARTCGNVALAEKMGLESVLFSRFMLYVGIQYFLEASRSFTRVYGMHEETRVLESGCSIIQQELISMAPHVGSH